MQELVRRSGVFDCLWVVGFPQVRLSESDTTESTRFYMSIIITTTKLLVSPPIRTIPRFKNGIFSYVNEELVDVLLVKNFLTSLNHNVPVQRLRRPMKRD